MGCCNRCSSRCCNGRYCGYIAKGLFVRFCFIVFILICTLVLPPSWYGITSFAIGIAFACLAILLLLIEACYTLCYSDRGEWRRFWPCMFFFLVGTVPILCILIVSSFDIGSCGCKTEADNYIGLNPEQRRATVKILEQSLVVILILGRWILPRGYVTREKLSDILLAYLGMSADMLDFLSEGLENEQVLCLKGDGLGIIILSVFTLSLFQLPIGVTSLYIDRNNAAVSEGNKLGEVWSILLTMFMHDGPYFIVRVYLSCLLLTDPKGSINEAADRFFFAIKNMLVLLLQLYRLYIILWRYNRGNNYMWPIQERNRELYVNLDEINLPVHSESTNIQITT